MRTLLVVFTLMINFAFGQSDVILGKIKEYPNASEKKKSKIIQVLKKDPTKTITTILSACENNQMSLPTAGQLISEWDFVSVEPLLTQLHDDNSQRRILACNLLGHVSRDFRLAPLVQKLADSEYYVRYAAAAALEKLGPKVVAEMLKFTGDSNYKMRANVCYVISKLKAKNLEICSAILPLMDDSETIVRRNAINSVGSMGEFALPHIARIYDFLSDENYDIRSNARWGLINLAKEHEEAVDFLYQRIHTSTTEREELLTVIREVGVVGKKMIPALKSLVNTSEDPHFYQVVNCIKSLDPECKYSQDFFLMLLQSNKPADQSSALQAFRYLPEDSLHKETLQIVASRFFSSDATTKRTIAEIFSKNRSKSKHILSTLLPALSEKDTTTLIFVVRSLQKTKEQAEVVTRKLTQIAKQTTDPSVKREIEAALQALIDGTTKELSTKLIYSNNQDLTKQTLNRIINDYKQEGKTLKAESLTFLLDLLQNDQQKSLHPLVIQALQAAPSEKSYISYATKCLLNHLNHENNLANQQQILEVIQHYATNNPQFFSQAESIVHQLKTFLWNPHLRYSTLSILGEVGEASVVAIPELQDMWHDQMEMASVVWVLGKIGPQARVAKSLILSGVKNEREEIRVLSLWTAKRVGIKVEAGSDSVTKLMSSDLLRLRNQAKDIDS